MISKHLTLIRIPASLRPVFFGLVLALATIASPCPAADAPAAPPTVLHSFSTVDGKTFRAQITEVAGGLASLQGADGSTVKIRTALFNPDDQIYIGQWECQCAVKDGAKVFDFKAVPTTETMDPDRTQTLHGLLGYKVTMTNQTKLSLVKPVVRYVAVTCYNTSAPDDAVMLTFGTFKSNDLSPGATISFDTDKAKVTYQAGKLLGLLIRIYDGEGNVVQEWTTTPDLAKSILVPFPRSGTGYVRNIAPTKT